MQPESPENPDIAIISLGTQALVTRRSPDAFMHLGESNSGGQSITLLSSPGLWPLW